MKNKNINNMHLISCNYINFIFLIFLLNSVFFGLVFCTEKNQSLEFHYKLDLKTFEKIQNRFFINMVSTLKDIEIPNHSYELPSLGEDAIIKLINTKINYNSLEKPSTNIKFKGENLLHIDGYFFAVNGSFNAVYKNRDKIQKISNEIKYSTKKFYLDFDVKFSTKINEKESKTKKLKLDFINNNLDLDVNLDLSNLIEKSELNEKFFDESVRKILENDIKNTIKKITNENTKKLIDEMYNNFDSTYKLKNNSSINISFGLSKEPYIVDNFFNFHLIFYIFKESEKYLEHDCSKEDFESLNEINEKTLQYISEFFFEKGLLNFITEIPNILELIPKINLKNTKNNPFIVFMKQLEDKYPSNKGLTIYEVKKIPEIELRKNSLFVSLVFHIEIFAISDKKEKIAEYETNIELKFDLIEYTKLNYQMVISEYQIKKQELIGTPHMNKKASKFILQFQIINLIEKIDNFFYPNLNLIIPSENRLDLVPDYQKLKLDSIRPKKYNEKYAYYKLPNGIEVIISQNIKKSKDQKDTIGLVTSSGSNNQGKILGLAHLLEHSLFLGSKKYPNENVFFNFIKSNQGEFNGFTDKTTTGFYYEINQQKFEESLDIFLNVFIEPLLEENHLKKEISAVNSEYKRNFHLSSTKFERFLNYLMNPEYPSYKFNTGCRETLSGDHLDSKTLRKEVYDLFKRTFISKNIKLIINTSEDLDEIMKKIFENLMKFNRKPINSFRAELIKKLQDEKYPLPYTEKEKGKVIFYQSYFKTMKISYILDDLNQDIKKSPKMYFKYIFDKEYPNSLKNILIKQRLIINFSTKFKEIDNRTKIFFINLTLTEKGLRKIDIILKIVNRFIELLKKNILNLKNFKLIQKNVNRLFNSKSPIKGFYKSIKILLKNFSINGKDYIFTSDDFLHEYNEKEIQKYVDKMTLDNSQIFISSPSFKAIESTDFYKILTNINDIEQKGFLGLEKNPDLKKENFFKNEEYFYKIKFTDFKLSHEQIEKSLQNLDNDFNLKFPTFEYQKKISEKKTLCTDDKGNTIPKSTCKKLFLQDSRELFPILIKKNNSTQVFIKKDRTHLDKAFILNTKLIPNHEVFNLDNNKNIIFIKLLINQMNFIFNQYMKNRNNDFNRLTTVLFKDNYLKMIPTFFKKNEEEKITQEEFTIDGIHIQIKTTSKDVLNNSDVFDLIEKIIDSDINEEDFIFLKEDLKRNCGFYITSNPTFQAFNWFYRLTFKNDVDYFTISRHINNSTLEEFKEFKMNLFNVTKSNLKMMILGVGTIEEDDLIDYSEKLENIILKKKHLNLREEDEILTEITYHNFSISNTNQQFLDLINSNDKKKFIFENKNFFKHSPDSSTVNFYFLGQKNIRNTVNINMIHQIAGSIFFNILRVELQLGYSISNKIMNIQNNLVYAIHVQGSKKSPARVRKNIEDVILKIKDKIKNMKEIDFYKIKTFVSNQLNFVSKDLKDKNKYFLSYMLGYESIFPKEKLSDYIDLIKKEELIDYVDKILENELSVQISNRMFEKETHDQKYTYIENKDYFRKIGPYISSIKVDDEEPKLYELADK